MTDCESDMSNSQFYNRIIETKNPRTYELQPFYNKHKLKTHEVTVLHMISGNKAELEKSARDRDPFFSKNFRQACKNVLDQLHGVKLDLRKKPALQLARI